MDGFTLHDSAGGFGHGGVVDGGVEIVSLAGGLQVEFKGQGNFKTLGEHAFLGKDAVTAKKAETVDVESVGHGENWGEDGLRGKRG